MGKINVTFTCFGFSFHMKGLGRSEQGCTDHIKVKLKNDSYGLGASASYEVRTFNTLIKLFIYLIVYFFIFLFNASQNQIVVYFE